MELLSHAREFFSDPARWEGPTGIPARLWEHAQISLLALAVAALIALPIGLYIGHTRRGEFIAVSVANLGRAMPSFGILAIVFPFTLRYLPGIGFYPTLIALTLLAIPPILTNAYVGIQGVDRETVEAARGMGLKEREVLVSLEVPLATPLIIAGLRTAAVAVVATATLAALVAWGGLGRFIIDGFAQGDDSQIVGGAVLVAGLAVVTEVVFAIVERVASPKGTTRASFFETEGPPVISI